MICHISYILYSLNVKPSLGPPLPPNYTLFNGQQYAMQLVTTIGYGNITSYTTGARWFAFVFAFFGIISRLAPRK